MASREEIVDSFLRRHGIKFSYEWAGSADYGRNEWRVKFSQRGKQWTLKFSCPGEPDAYHVLCCVAADAHIHENDEYDDLGYDPETDAEEYQRIKKACEKEYCRYHEFFGSLTDVLDYTELLDTGDSEDYAEAEAKFAEVGEG